MPHVPSNENIADLFTKPLCAKQFFYLRDIVMNVPSQRELHVNKVMPAVGG